MDNVYSYQCQLIVKNPKIEDYFYTTILEIIHHSVSSYLAITLPWCLPAFPSSLPFRNGRRLHVPRALRDQQRICSNRSDSITKKFKTAEYYIIILSLFFIQLSSKDYILFFRVCFRVKTYISFVSPKISTTTSIFQWYKAKQRQLQIRITVINFKKN